MLQTTFRFHAVVILRLCLSKQGLEYVTAPLLSSGANGYQRRWPLPSVTQKSRRSNVQESVFAGFGRAIAKAP